MEKEIKDGKIILTVGQDSREVTLKNDGYDHINYIELHREFSTEPIDESFIENLDWVNRQIWVEKQKKDISKLLGMPDIVELDESTFNIIENSVNANISECNDKIEASKGCTYTLERLELYLQLLEMEKSNYTLKM